MTTKRAVTLNVLGICAGVLVHLIAGDMLLWQRFVLVVPVGLALVSLVDYLEETDT